MAANEAFSLPWWMNALRARSVRARSIYNQIFLFLPWTVPVTQSSLQPAAMKLRWDQTTSGGSSALHTPFQIFHLFSSWWQSKSGHAVKVCSNVVRCKWMLIFDSHINHSVRTHTHTTCSSLLKVVFTLASLQLIKQTVCRNDANRSCSLLVGWFVPENTVAVCWSYTSSDLAS